MSLDPVTAGIDALAPILKHFFPDPADLAKAQELQRQGALDELRLLIQDRISARERESSVKDNTNRILAYVIIGSFVSMVAGTLMGYARIDGALAGTLVGYLSAKAEQVLAYYFGSSAGSAQKTELLAKADAIRD